MTIVLPGGTAGRGSTVPLNAGRLTRMGLVQSYKTLESIPIIIIASDLFLL